MRAHVHSKMLRIVLLISLQLFILLYFSNHVAIYCFARESSCCTGNAPRINKPIWDRIQSPFQWQSISIYLNGCFSFGFSEVLGTLPHSHRDPPLNSRKSQERNWVKSNKVLSTPVLIQHLKLYFRPVTIHTECSDCFCV